MRPVLVAVLALSALALTACDPADSSRGGPVTSTSATVGASSTDSQADADYNAGMTKATCAEAAKINEDGVAAFEADVANLLDLAAEGDQVKLDAAKQELHATLTAWSVKLIEMSGRPVAPVGALEEGAATVERIADPNDKTPVNQAKEALAHVGDKIRAACATGSE